MTDTAPQPMVPMHGLTEALHLGEDDTPWVYAGDLGIKLLHVDLNQGLWILRNRFPAGYRVQRHYHTGPVYALTLAGSWGYEEYPEYLNRPGSYLYEPAHSVHTLVVPEDNDGETDVWFAIHGANVNVQSSEGFTAYGYAKRRLNRLNRMAAKSPGGPTLFPPSVD